MIFKKAILVSFLTMSCFSYSMESNFSEKLENWEKNREISCCSRPEEQKCCLGLLLLSSYFFLPFNSDFVKDPADQLVCSPCFVVGGTLCIEATGDIIKRSCYLKNLDLKKIE